MEDWNVEDPVFSGDGIMISACLLGIHCRYDGRHSICLDLVDFVASRRFTPFCPEQLGGLPTPRPAANIIGGDGRDILSGSARLVDSEGKDVTGAFKRGAEEALRLARLAGSSIAIMKERSPSCGLKTPYCDKPRGMGIGVTAALFESEGIKIIELGANDTFPTPGFFQILKSLRE
jgi:uncharacterized protein YbbK (DUF523 family)